MPHKTAEVSSEHDVHSPVMGIRSWVALLLAVALLALGVAFDWTTSQITVE